MRSLKVGSGNVGNVGNNNNRSSQRQNQHTISIGRQSDQSQFRTNRGNSVCFGLGIAVGFLVSSLLTSLVSTDVMIPVGRAGAEAEAYQSLLSFDHPKAPEDGWKLLHVYVGSSSSDLQGPARIQQHAVQASNIPSAYYQTTSWFSQVRQDFVVSTLLRGQRNGYFLDLAANDAIRISNTFALERDYGWTGLAIEPNPIYWSGLSYRSCHVVAAVIGNQTGDEVRFKFSKRKPQRGGLVGPTFDNKDDINTNSAKSNKADRSAKSTPGEEQMRTAVSLLDLFQHFRTPSVIDYFSLDVEGAETFIMESFPFHQYRFNVLTVERADDRLRFLLEQHGYVKLKDLKQWGESLWVHSSIQATIDRSALTIETENYQYRENIKPNRLP